MVNINRPMAEGWSYSSK